MSAASPTRRGGPLVQLAQVPWKYTLYEDPDTHEQVLSVLCGTVGLFELHLPLTADEAAAAADPDWLARRADEVARNPGRFAHQSIEIAKPPAP